MTAAPGSVSSSPDPIGPWLRVASVQMDIAWEDKPRNIERARGMLACAGLPTEDPDTLVVLPEMFATGYTMNAPAADEGDDRPAEHFIAETSVRYGAAVGGVVSRSSDGAYRNEAVACIGRGQPAARYAKMRPMTIAGEADHYAAGDRVVTFDYAGARVCPLVCYDLRFGELFHAGVRQGAEVFVVIANFPAARASHWRALLIARAIEFQAAVVGVNRVGSDANGIDYAGGSIVVDHYGQIIAEADDREQVMTTRVDLGLLRKWREEFPVLADMG